MTSFLRHALLPLLAALALAPAAHAAEPWTGGGAQTRNGVQRPGWDDLERAHWIADGRDDAPRKIYVFMDANCKYCTLMWSDARPWVESGKVQLRYLMVAVIAPSSAGKAAAILADRDPLARFNDFERAHAFGVARAMATGQHSSLDDPRLQPLDPLPPEQRRVLLDHERLMSDLALTGTPGIVFRTGDGTVVARSGLNERDLPLILGPR